MTKKFLDYYGPDAGYESAVSSALTSFNEQEIQLLARFFGKLNQRLSAKT
ncbi:MAG: hypothetical protein R2912_09910 [Eubacteriales bacterium]